MTGIAAIFSPAPGRAGQAARMMQALSHRRHEDRAWLAKGAIGLGACTMHTTPESCEAAQPHANEDASVAIALDGFLANWEELRSDLLSRGAHLRNRSDAELVLRAYEQWGEDCTGRLDGEFAFVVADWRRHRMFCARDHLGLKPLYFHRSGNEVLAASDVAVIIEALERRPEPDLDFLACLAAGDVFSGERTAWQGIQSLPHAHWLACDGSAAILRRYYQLPCGPLLRYRSEHEYAEHHRAELFDAVRRTSRSQAPLAFEVSGGLDSSALFVIADQLHREGRLQAPDIRGYTLAGEPGTGAYELPYARAVADHVGQDIVEVPLFAPAQDWYARQAGIDHDVPPPTNGVMSINLEARAAADGARVLVTGIGGDEWLGGSHVFYRQLAQRREGRAFIRSLRADMAARGAAKPLRSAIRMGLAGLLPDSVLARIKQMRGADPFAGAADPLWLRPEWRARVAQLRMDYLQSLPSGFDQRLQEGRYADPWALYYRSRMQRQPAANGLELRYPFLSRRFVEFSAAVPEHLRFHGGINKYTHRNALRGLLPEAVVNRTSKAEFSAPAANREFIRFCSGAGAASLGALISEQEIVRHFCFGEVSAVDDSLTWEIYGVHAVACFLQHVGWEGCAPSRDSKLENDCEQA